MDRVLSLIEHYGYLVVLEAASRLAGEHVRAGYIGRFEQPVKVVYDVRSASWRGCGITSPDVGSVVGARHMLARIFWKPEM